jgi:hypothetical protein
MKLLVAVTLMVALQYHGYVQQFVLSVVDDQYAHSNLPPTSVPNDSRSLMDRGRDVSTWHVESREVYKFERFISKAEFDGLGGLTPEKWTCEN